MKSYLNYHFAPNNHEGSKPLFTGRVNDLNEIFELLLAGNCIGLFGERRSGKSLTLDTVKEIISGGIHKYKNELIDQRLQEAIPDWESRLSDFDAIYVTLSAARNEDELVYEIKSSLLENLRAKPTTMSSLSHENISLRRLFDYLEQILVSNGRKIVILIDEMEILGEFENSGAIAELFCDRVKYRHLIFVHAGSYEWFERVTTPGSLFTHLARIYMGSLEHEALVNYLLAPINGANTRNIIAEASGGKPLYVQLIGQLVMRSNGIYEESEILSNHNFCMQIENNIFYERQLSPVAKNILALLSHEPNLSILQIARKLEISTTTAQTALNKLKRFGTITESKSKNWGMFGFSNTFNICGTIFGKYGKHICENPSKDTFSLVEVVSKFNYLVIFRWVLASVFLLTAIGIYRYANPSLVLIESSFSNGIVKLEFPQSVEPQEIGDVNISIQNTSQFTISALKLRLESNDVVFSNNDDRSFIEFKNLSPGDGATGSLNYRVLINGTSVFSTSVVVNDATVVTWNTTRHGIPVKRYANILSSIFLLVGSVLIPQHLWSKLLSIAKKALPSVDISKGIEDTDDKS